MSGIKSVQKVRAVVKKAKPYAKLDIRSRGYPTNSAEVQFDPSGDVREMMMVTAFSVANALIAAGGDLRIWHNPRSGSEIVEAPSLLVAFNGGLSGCPDWSVELWTKLAEPFVQQREAWAADRKAEKAKEAAERAKRDRMRYDKAVELNPELSYTIVDECTVDQGDGPIEMGVAHTVVNGVNGKCWLMFWFEKKMTYTYSVERDGSLAYSLHINQAAQRADMRWGYEVGSSTISGVASIKEGLLKFIATWLV